MTQEDTLTQLKGILSRCRGQSNSITSQELSDALGGLDGIDSNPRTRALIRELVRSGTPIGAWSGGYYWIETEEELDRYCSDLKQREDKIRERRFSVREAFVEDE